MRNKLHPGEAWLKNLWSWLRSEYPKDLSKFEGIPLIPATTNRPDGRSLIKLQKTHSVIKSSSHFASLPRNTVSALQKAGCIVISHLPSFCDHMALVQYVEPPTASGVVKVIKKYRRQSFPEPNGSQYRPYAPGIVSFKENVIRIGNRPIFVVQVRHRVLENVYLVRLKKKRFDEKRRERGTAENVTDTRITKVLAIKKLKL